MSIFVKAKTYWSERVKNDETERKKREKREEGEREKELRDEAFGKW